MEDSARRRPSIERAQMLWLYRLIFTPHPLAEVMTLAWHSHYATSQAKVNSPELMLAQNLTFRSLWRAPISQLHQTMLDDGAMLRWLDGLNSTKAHPNENLAREFLELFALGEGQLHRARRPRGRPGPDRLARDRFQQKRDGLDPGDHDDGPKTILGQTGPWGRDDVVRIACRQPAAATHIARRLYRTFVSDTEEPSTELLAPLAAAMRIDGDVDVARGIELVLRSRLFHPTNAARSASRARSSWRSARSAPARRSTLRPTWSSWRSFSPGWASGCSIRPTSPAGLADWPGFAARPCWHGPTSRPGCAGPHRV